MSSDNFAIHVSGLSKCYQIYDAPRDRLKQFVVPTMQRFIGRSPTKYFREFWALRDVSFDVKKGETVGIIGRNGSGKSTLLQVICGTLTPTSGEVVTAGRIAALLELGSGFNPEFTGRENVYMNAALLAMSKEEVDERFDDIASFADIGQFMDQPVKTYSSGMLVRLAFSVQATVDPQILIVDEALAVGDEVFQRKCYARLEELKNRGTSILFVSHSAASIVELCDRTLLLDQGMRLMYGDAAKAIRAYQKLIYAPAEEQKRLVGTYRLADETGCAPEDINEIEASCDPTVYDVSEAFDPGLIPETTTVYPVQGAEIDSFQILDAQGRLVNVLRPREAYRFVVSGRFLKAFDGVFFGIHIKNISGLEITGQRHPEEGTYLQRVEAGRSFRIEFGFNMDLTPGVYFVGGGVWSSQEPTCAHRVLDALMFRVITTRRPVSFGYVDIASREAFVSVY